MEEDMDLGDDDELLIEQEDGSVMVLTPQDEEDDDFGENLASSMPSEAITQIASDLEYSVKLDIDSRKKRDDFYAEGIRKTGLSEEAVKSTAFNGSSDAVHPILAEISVDFSARAIKEIFPASGLVKIASELTNPQVLEVAERKRMFLNWQTSTQMVELRDNLEQCLTQVPLGGSQYIKLSPDIIKKRPTSEFVPIDDLFIPYAAANIYSAERITHRLWITKAEYESMVKSGIYLDTASASSSSILEQSAAKEMTDSVQGIEEPMYNDDGLRDFYEISTYLSLQEDPISGGERAPYIVTMDRATQQVVSIYRNWDPSDPTMERLHWIIEFKFIPWRGPYGIGIFHLVGSLATSMTGALRALLDAGHVNNIPSLLRLKGAKVSGQSVQMSIGSVTDIEASALTDDIRKLMMAVPFNPPSPTLFQLLEWCTNAARGVISTAEEQISNIGDRTPVGTTTAMIEQGSYTYSAIHARLHASMAMLLKILQRINRQYLQEFNTNPSIPVSPEDFVDNGDLIPVSDPNIFSEAQRMAQVQAVMQLSADQTVPYNKPELHRRILKLLRIKDIDSLLPPLPVPFTDNDPQVEDAQALQGKQLQATPEQDHLHHIVMHLQFIMNPIFGVQAPLAPYPAFQQMLNHVQVHFAMLYQALPQMVMQIAQQANGHGQIPPQIIEQQIYQQLQQISVSLLQPAIQAVSSKAPAPPMDPMLQVAQMQEQTKLQVAQLNNQTDAQQAQMDAQLEQMKLSLEANTQAQRIALEQFIQTQLEPQLAELKSQTDLMKNERDNIQKSQTERAKNSEDNETNLLITQLREEAANERAIIVQEMKNRQEELTEELKALVQLMIQRQQEKE